MGWVTTGPGNLDNGVVLLSWKLLVLVVPMRLLPGEEMAFTFFGI
jgi:hypothetical protein